MKKEKRKKNPAAIFAKGLYKGYNLLYRTEAAFCGNLYKKYSRI